MTERGLACGVRSAADPPAAAAGPPVRHAWRAAPLLTAECVAAAVGSATLMLAYPLGFRAIVDGAADHHRGRIITGLIITAVAFPGGWVLQLIGATLNAKMTDLTNLSLSLRIGDLTCEAPFLEHFERPDYLAEIDTLRERRRTLAGAPRRPWAWSARECSSSARPCCSRWSGRRWW